MTAETILTDDQIDHIIEDVAWPNEEVFNFGREVSRAIEQAVLAKLAEQEPVAWVSSESFSSDGTSDIMNKNLKIGTKLYAYPIPCVSPTIHKNDCVSEIAESETQPTAWLNEETGDVISSELKDDAPEMLKGYDTPLYKCPVPNSQVNLDSSNHIADMRKMVKENHIPDASKMVTPDGWQLVPVEPTDEMLVSGQEEWVLGKRGAMEDCEESKAIFKAMLAAAPKYKWGKE